jgi:hypothetical protein
MCCGMGTGQEKFKSLEGRSSTPGKLVGAAREVGSFKDTPSMSQNASWGGR